MTLDELLQSSRVGLEEKEYYTIDEIYSIIKDCYSWGVPAYIFNDNIRCQKDSLTIKQVSQLRADGYTVQFNPRGSKWYVSGW